MRAMVMTDQPDGVSRQRLRMQDRPQPEPEGPFDVVVRVAAAGVCRSDLHILMGELPVSVPHVLGHENSGWVHAVGSMVSSVGVGDRVLCYPFVSDGLSAPERRGVDSAAPGRRTPGIDCDGGYAEYLLVTERSLIPLPADADLAAMATLSDAGLAAYRACRKAATALEPGSLAVVLGVGGSVTSRCRSCARRRRPGSWPSTPRRSPRSGDVMRSAPRLLTRGARRGGRIGGRRRDRLRRKRRVGFAAGASPASSFGGRVLRCRGGRLADDSDPAAGRQRDPDRGRIRRHLPGARRADAAGPARRHPPRGRALRA